MPFMAKMSQPLDKVPKGPYTVEYFDKIQVIKKKENCRVEIK